MASQLQVLLNVPSSMVNSLTLHPEGFYKKIERYKMKFGRQQIDEHGAPKTRITEAPNYFLKLKQREIHAILQQKTVLPNCIFGGVLGKNNIDNANYHKYSSNFLTIDLKDFFSKINNRQVNRALRQQGFTWEDARFITKLCTVKGYLPQGAPTSSILANIVIAPTAIALEEYCLARDIRFTLFVDDLTFSANYSFKSSVHQILNIIANNGFSLNYKKIKYSHKSCEITGLIIKKGKLSLEKEMQKNLDNPHIKAYAKNVGKRN